MLTPTFDCECPCPFCGFCALSVERITKDSNSGSRYGRVICNHCQHHIRYLDKSNYWREINNKNAYVGCRRITQCFNSS